MLTSIISFGVILAFTGALFLISIPYYIAEVGDGDTILPVFYLICILLILVAAFSSTEVKFVKVLSVSFTGLFSGLIGFIYVNAGMTAGDLASSGSNIAGYFTYLHQFIKPLTENHEFYLLCWFAWSIMIGQFVSRFVGGLKTYQLLEALLIFPSIPLALWFSVLYFYFLNGIGAEGIPNWAITVVGIVFMVNSFDSLIRIYTDNLNLTTERFGTVFYVSANAIGLFALTLLFQSHWVQMQWDGTVIIAIYLGALAYMLFVKQNHMKDLDGQAAPLN